MMRERSTREPSAPAAHDVVQHLLAVVPDLDEGDQRLSLALYRALAQGAPVPPSQLAIRLGTSVDEVDRRLANWSGVSRDDRQHIVGYWSLTIVPTRHRLRIGERDLYTWCAWDTLFIPALLGARAQVNSSCCDTESPVRLTVGPGALEAASPENLWVSFVLPSAESMRRDLRASFCHNVHFFRSPDLATLHAVLPPSAFVLTLADAFQVGRARNRSRYGLVADLLTVTSEAQ
jgi:alkylmercury lyase